MSGPAVAAFESISTWRQPAPASTSPNRLRLLDDVAAAIVARGLHRLRVAVDGYTAAGKTSFGHELAAAVRRLGRPTLRASFDDFKKPWRHAIEHGYDRITGEGYYRNAPDFESARTLLLEPAGPAGSGRVVLCAHDPLTGDDHRSVTIAAPTDSVLIVDSVFAFRPEYDEYWDYRIWLDIDPAVSLERAIARDAGREGAAEAEALHRDRYHAAEEIYLAEVDPVAHADVIIDNTDFAAPIITDR